VSLANPKQNLALPHAVQRRVDAMFAGASTGFSGPELIEYFSRLDPNVEAYPRQGAPSRKQILQDCLARFTREQQLDILLDMLRTENFAKYSAPAPEDRQFLVDWITSQRVGHATIAAPSMPSQPAVETRTWDVFISHASEDKELFARPLAEALQSHGVTVWFDAFTLRVGDSLRQAIDRGLACSRYGVVVLSDAFFQKHWPQRELDGLVARESSGGKVLLPVWHGVDEARVRAYSPTLADRFAVSSSKGVEHVVEQLLHVLKPGTP